MINTIALVVALLNTPAQAIEPGTYVLFGRVLNDVAAGQEIEISNIRRRTNSYASFDVHISTNGGFKRFPEDTQVVQGINYDNELMFIIPFANITNVTGYKFIFDDKEVDGKYRGKVYISGQRKGEAKEGPFEFTMTRKGAR